MPNCRIGVRLTPRGGRDAVEGWTQAADGRPLLKVRVAAPPVDGAANAALLRLLARTLDCRGGAVRLVGGDTARIKTVDIEGVTEAVLQKRLPSRPG